MKFTATLYGDANDFDAPPPDVEIEFNDVKEVHRDQMFFTVIKNNGDQHATRVHTVKKFTLIN